MINEFIKYTKDEDCLHVFLINNPFTGIISRMIIDAYQIKECNVFSVSTRNTDTSLVSKAPFILKMNFLDRLQIKFFRQSPQASRLLRRISKKNKKFFLYTAWAYEETIRTSDGVRVTNSHPSVQKLLKSDLCMGHAYIEEGQLTHRQTKIYPPEDRQRLHDEYIMRLNGQFRDDEHRLKNRLYYRNDAHVFIGAVEGAFPNAPKDKRIILNNYNALKGHYDPLLLGTKMIGLTCAERRLSIEQWQPMLEKLINQMPNGGVIKLHPSFITNVEKNRRIKNIFNKIAPSNIDFCEDETIIEMEMLYEPKRLIGSRTSLKKYAEAFGSEFIDVKLY